MTTAQDQRRSRRYRQVVQVDLSDRHGVRRGRAVDVARHGLFVAVVDPPQNRHLVQLTIHLPDGPLQAAASVSRVLPGQGVGLSLFALGSEAKSRWDRFIVGIERGESSGPIDRAPPLASTTSATSTTSTASTSSTTSVLPTMRPARPSTPSFVVKLKTLERLEDYRAQHIAAGGTVLFTPVLPPAGTAVRLLVVHPTTESEFVVNGVVHRAISEAPKRLEILFRDVDVDSFGHFIQTGLPKASPSIIAAAPGPAPLTSPPTMVPMPATDLRDQLPDDVIPETTPELPGFDIDFAEEFDDDDVVGDEPIEWDLRTSDLPVILGAAIPEEKPPHRPAPGNDDVTLRPQPAPVVEDDDPIEELLFDDTQMARDPGLRPTPFRVRCNERTCRSEPYVIELGPCSGTLGLVADLVPFWSDESARLVSVPRSLTAERRRMRFVDYVGKGGQIDDLLPLGAFLAAVDLAERPRHPNTAEILRTTRAVDRVARSAERLANDADAFASGPTRIRCPHCDFGVLTLERA